MRIRCAMALLLLWGAAGAEDLAVIAPRAFWGAAKEWKAHREAQGHVVAFHLPGKELPAQVKKIAAASAGKLRFVLLLGDVNHVACGYEAGAIIVPYERDPRIATDHHLADLDGDSLPDLAVGRLPADSAEEAEAMFAKVLAYERDPDLGFWRRRVNVIAGVGGFGALQDWAIEQVATKFLTENIPADLDLHVTYGNPSSPFCPFPPRIGEVTLERFNEGALVVAYLGHGNRAALDRLHYQGSAYTIFDEDAAFQMESRHGAPIAIFVACSTGHMDGAPDSLAEQVLRQPRGPVAVIASSRVSMPYANGVVAKELMDALFLQRLPTLGEIFQQAKRRLVVPAEGDEGRQFIEMLAMGYQLRDDLRLKERAEHLYLYNLFGDPAMRVALPAVASLTAPEGAAAGATVSVSGSAPFACTGRLELVTARTALRTQRRGESEAEFQRCYTAANEWVRASWEVTLAEGAFTSEVTLPADLVKGAYVLRLYVAGEKECATAARPLRIEPKS